MQSRAERCRASAPLQPKKSYWRYARATVFALALAAVGCENGGKGSQVLIQSAQGPVSVNVELAVSPAIQARGLMFRSDLGENEGMLFIFPKDASRSFWMKNTPLSLDIMYIGADQIIGHIAERTTPYSETSIPSHGPARYVLEVNAGFSARHGIRAGDRIELAGTDLP
ncbi:MAG: uncharacterized membrane protein (UPF0127 family) [Hyphomicrobiaceae bacterium]|jgi:uncharacterized membrane protein (UPF0127 family)